MKPHVLLIEPMMPEVEAQLDVCTACLWHTTAQR
jgi:hypothetical protein